MLDEELSAFMIDYSSDISRIDRGLTEILVIPKTHSIYSIALLMMPLKIYFDVFKLGGLNRFPIQQLKQAHIDGVRLGCLGKDLSTQPLAADSDFDLTFKAFYAVRVRENVAPSLVNDNCR